MSSEIEQAIRQICDEKGLSYESVIETIEAALAAAYRKDYGNKMQNIEAEFDPATGHVKLFDVKTVVENMSDEELAALQEEQARRAEEREAEEAAHEFALPKKKEEAQDAKDAQDAEKAKGDAIGGEPQLSQEDEEGGEEEDEGPKFNPKTEIMERDAQILKMGSKVGDVLRTELPLPGEFGRMAAMTAKQVITQKLREAEREIVFNEYKEQEGEVLIGTVQRREGRVVLVDIGRTVGVLTPEDQVPGERYNPGDRLKVFVREVSLGTRGPQILLSRTSEELVRVLFEIEIPEVADGLVEIKGIAREAGSRSKVAVATKDESIDPIGACIGQRGIRIQTIINELGGEKIDVIEWSDDPIVYITNALSPAKIIDIELDEAENTATATVDADQLSLAIGRGGQNVRLAARLADWKLSVREEGEEEISTDGDTDEETDQTRIEEAQDAEEAEDAKDAEEAEDQSEETKEA